MMEAPDPAGEAPWSSPTASWGKHPMRAPRKYGRNHERPLLWKITAVESGCGIRYKTGFRYTKARLLS